jgi:hypothetical protein
LAVPVLLRVDADGLASGAAESSGIASALAAGGSGGGGGNQASHAGVFAVDAALSSVRLLQSGSVGQQATDLQTASIQYGDTDGHNAGDIGETM